MKKSSYIFLFITILIFLFGFYLRFDFYLYNRPLWHDECSLALSIINKNIFDYLGLLEHHQSAPYLFMIITKLNSMIFGIKEYVLRLFPFICGILSVPVFYFFSKLFITKRIPLLIVNFLFSINYYLIYYSQEFKQYSSDVLMFMVCFMFMFKLDISKSSHKNLLLLGCLFGFLPMLSFPLSFIIMGFILYQLIIYKKSILKKLSVFLTPIIILWVINLLGVILPEHTQKLVYDGNFWDNGFISLSIFQIFKLLKMNLLYYFYPNNFVFCQMILILCGIYYLIKNKTKLNIFLGCIFIFILLASLFGVYPIYERVSLYLIPVILVLIAFPFNFVGIKQHLLFGFLIVSFLLSICNYNLSYLKRLQETNIFSQYDAREAMQTLISQYKNSKSYIIVNAASDSEFDYYKKYFDFRPENVLYMQLPHYSKNNYFTALDTLPAGYDYWFYCAYDYSHSPVIPFLKEYSSQYSKLYEADVKKTYLLHLKK